ASTTLNCGYGRGYSVREVLDAVRRAVGHPFAVNFGARRPGDIVVSVAAANRIRELLNWTPELDDLDAIVGHALAWERHLMARAEPRVRAAISASFYSQSAPSDFSLKKPGATGKERLVERLLAHPGSPAAARA